MSPQGSAGDRVSFSPTTTSGVSGTSISLTRNPFGRGSVSAGGWELAMRSCLFVYRRKPSSDTTEENERMGLLESKSAVGQASVHSSPADQNSSVLHGVTRDLEKVHG